MKRIIGILTLSCLLFSACGKDEILQEENEKKTEETTPGGDTGGDESDDDPDSPKLVVPLHVEGRYLKNEQGKIVNLHGFTQTYIVEMVLYTFDFLIIFVSFPGN